MSQSIKSYPFRRWRGKGEGGKEVEGEGRKGERRGGGEEA